ncbi:MAG: hypothetical protein ACYTG1_05645 [Planctomycetota bacterium]
MSRRPRIPDDVDLDTEVSSPMDPEDPPSGLMTMQEAEALPDSRAAIRSGKLAGRSMGSAIWILAAPVLLQQTAHAGVGRWWTRSSPAGSRPRSWSRASTPSASGRTSPGSS